MKLLTDCGSHHLLFSSLIIHSDSVVLISSQRVPASEGDIKEFDIALQALCKDLAVDVVRNGVRER